MRSVKHNLDTNASNYTSFGYVETLHPTIWYHLLRSKHHLKPVQDRADNLYVIIKRNFRLKSSSLFQFQKSREHRTKT